MVYGFKVEPNPHVILDLEDGEEFNVYPDFFNVKQTKVEQVG